MKKTLLLFFVLSCLVRTSAQQESVQTAQTGIINFNARRINQNVQLVWTVRYNEEIRSFEIERLEKDSVYKKIGGRLPGAGTGTSQYEFVDAMVKSTGFLYRIKAICKDGTVHVSEPLPPGKEPETTFRLKQNPVRQNIDLEINCPEPTTVTATVYTADGLKLFSQTNPLQPHVNFISVPSQSLKPGIYRLTLDTGRERKVISFVKE